jgi:ribosomal protein S18 acetylase RimI-like enzyme
MRRPAARDLAIRRASERDLEVVTALRLALLHEHRSNPVYGRLRPDVATRARRLYLAQLRSPNEVTLLAERGAEAVGILRCIHSAGHPLLLPPTYGYISSVYVRPAARRTGVLRALVDAAAAWSRERGLTELRLHNAADNPLSNAAWDSLGFAVVEHLRMRPLPAAD